METLRDPGLIRAACLFIPTLFAVGAWGLKDPKRPVMVGAVLAAGWIFTVLPLLNLAAFHFGWWTFGAEGGLAWGTPLDLLWGWGMLWGVLPALAFPEMSLPLLAALFLGLDLVLMPACRPIVQLGGPWLWGEAAVMLLGFIPAQVFARLTASGRRPGLRALCQVVMFTILFYIAIPLLIHSGLTRAEGGLDWTRHPWGWQFLILLAVPGLSAVQEFAKRGDGTPLPFDPPRRLVTTGVYAYWANPMQVSTALLYLAMSLMFQEPMFTAAAVLSWVYSVGFAHWHEGPDMRIKFGEPYGLYREAVQDWFPRFRPGVPEGSGPATLYYDAECGPCGDIAKWIQARNPVNLRLVPAQQHPSRDLERLTYDPGDGREEEGVAALGRGLEHLHLGWAFLSWTIRLPILSQFTQLITDAVGGGPRKVCRVPSPQTPK